MNSENEIYLTGDVRFSQLRGQKNNVEFLLELQRLMEEYGVIKIDLSIDPFKIPIDKIL